MQRVAWARAMSIPTTFRVRVPLHIPQVAGDAFLLPQGNYSGYIEYRARTADRKPLSQLAKAVIQLGHTQAELLGLISPSSDEGIELDVLRNIRLGDVDLSA